MNMSDPNRVALPGKFRIVLDLNYGGPYWGCSVEGDYDSLEQAKVALMRKKQEPHSEGIVSYTIYDDHGRQVGS